MTAIIQAIDAWMEATYGSLEHTFWGHCELSNRTTANVTQPIPVTITGTHQRLQVSLDDKKELITWIRQTSPTTTGVNIDDNDWGFGLDDGHVQTIPLRMVVASKVELGENLIYEIAHGIPALLSVVGYTIVSVDRGSITVDTDHETIYLTELGQGKYESHRFPWNLSVINFNVEAIINHNCISDDCCEKTEAMFTESGDCLIIE